MKSEERIEKVEKRVRTVEEAIVLLTQLSNSGAERMEKFLFGLEELRFNVEELRAGQHDTQEKINMLIDAQMRTEDQVREVSALVKAAHERIDKIDGK